MILTDEDRKICLSSLSKHKGMMDPRTKQRWVQALRDQEHQAIGVLENSNGARCALGVLLHIYPHKDELDLEWDTMLNNATGEYEEVLVVNGSETDIPDSVKNWSGLLQTALSEISDWNDHMMGLDVLADLIEEGL